MVLFDFEDNRAWKGLLVLGVLLNILVCFTSDLGLDTHVKMAVDESGALPWGDLRPDTAGFSDPNDGGERTVLPIYSGSEAAIKGLALVSFFGLIAFVYSAVGLRSATVLSLSPAFIFSIGRGYEEVYFAVVFTLAFGLFSGLWSDKGRAGQGLLGGWLLMCIPYAKGMVALPTVLGLGGVLGAFGLFWHRMQHHESSRLSWSTQPLLAGCAGIGMTSLFMLVVGGFGWSPTLAVMADHPLKYASSLLLAVFDAVGVFMLFGMVLWSLAMPAIQAMKGMKHATISTMVAMISAACTAIVFYIAALWTFEAVLWSAPWPGMVWTMGNNGRYVTLLFIPCVLLLKHIDLESGTPTFESPNQLTKAIGVTLLLLLPLTLLASVHGQTMWTDEAAEVMPVEQGDHFLFVSEATLGMHWLYTFYEPLDAQANNLTGHWRSMDVNWMDDLEQNLSQVTVIVLSPEVSDVPTGWGVESSGEADLLNGGGEWRVLTRT